MPTTAQLLRLVHTGASSESHTWTDTDLLRRYTAERDESAFAELVRRNGPLVLWACRHVLGEAAADDAFQATFLLLVRSASRLTRSGSLAGWLHATAVRISLNLRRGDNRRRQREADRRPARVAPDEMTWRDVREVLDKEIAALPERDRLPLVLCCVQELSYEEAAQRAGCPIGTLRSRLERGKERLRKRLARYGLPLAAPALVVGYPPPVSAALIAAVVSAVRSGISGKVPLALAGLLHPIGRLRDYLLLAPIVSVLVAIGTLLAVSGDPTADQPKVDPPRSATPIPVAATQPTVDRLGDPLPAGALVRLGTRRFFGPGEPRWAAFSPDGRKVASLSYNGVTICDAATGRQLVERKDYWVAGNAIGWRADGTGVAVVVLPDLTYFVSAFTDPDEMLPTPPRAKRPPVTPIPAVEYLALSPDATRLAIVRAPTEKQFTVDLLPVEVGKSVAGLKPLRTLGPFSGPCQEIRYTTRGVHLLTGSWEDDENWTITVVPLDRNAVTRAISIPPPAFHTYGYMYSLSPNARLAAMPLRPKDVKAGEHIGSRHDGTIRVWDLEAGKELHSFPFSRQLGYGTGHAFTSDGKKLIVAGENPYFQIWDVVTGEELAHFPKLNGDLGYREASAITVSPDGTRFATVRRDGRIEIWYTRSAKPVDSLDTHLAELATVAVCPEGRIVATLAKDDEIRAWELATGKPLWTIPAPRSERNHRDGPKRRLAFTPDGRGLLFTADEELALADSTTGKRLNLPGALDSFKGIASQFSADGKTLATFVNDTVTLWNWPAGTERLSISVPLAPSFHDRGREVVRIHASVALSPDGRFLFTNSLRQKETPPRDGFPNANDLWDAQTGKHLQRLEKPLTSYPPACFSPDSREIYLGGHSMDMLRGDDQRRRIDALTAWDPATGRLLHRFVEPDRNGRLRDLEWFGRHVQALAVSPDGRLLAVAETIPSFDGVWLYETASGRPLKKLEGHLRDVSDLAFSPDGRRLVTVSSDQTGLVWDVTLPTLSSWKGGKPTGKELVDAWERLSAADPGLGYLGIATLASAPANALTLLKERLHPAAVPTDADLDRVVAQLAASDFTDREKASAELERYGANAVAGSKSRLAGVNSPEARVRLTRFLSRFGADPSPYTLRSARGVAVLEAISTPEAKGFLAELARGKIDDVLTREASAAFRRVGNR